jgi:hypothetical protein
MAQDDLVGNLATEQLLNTLEQNGYSFSFNQEAFMKAQVISSSIFNVSSKPIDDTTA